MNETEIAYRIRQALDEGAQHLDYTVSLRLEKARNAALARSFAGPAADVWVPALQLAGARGAGSAEGRWGWLFRFGLAVPLLALAVGSVSIHQWQNERMIAEVADLDFAVLLDDTPIDTYAHQGFRTYLLSEESDQSAGQRVSQSLEVPSGEAADGPTTPAPAGT